MRTLITIAILFALASATHAAPADPVKFCAGFAEGYRSVRGDDATVPACPQERGVPRGSGSFREGVKVGIRAGRKKA